MSQDYFSDKGKSLAASPKVDDEQAPTMTTATESDAANPPERSGTRPRPPPQFLTVGSGLESFHAAQLRSELDDRNEFDSGYGGSSTGDDHALLSSATSLDARKHPSQHAGQPASLYQTLYNRHRSTLQRAINQTIQLLRELQDTNSSWPAHYPSVRRAEVTAFREPRPASRPGFPHAYSMLNEPELARASDLVRTSPSPPPTESLSSPPPPVPQQPALQRSMTALEDFAPAESSRAAESRAAAAAPAEPRLVTPQIAQEFSILKLDLKLGSLHQAELVHSLEKESIASLLDGKISSSVKHLLSLRDRIEDTASKVLITGDLNAGKSTFCNALLRRKILPEDQQPCTAIFCEVLDCKENGGVEEAHAVHRDSVYDRRDESTYDVFTLQELEKIVVDNETYTQCKIYVKDSRRVDESLLNNGVVDIALIDAPGLNSDTTKTTAIFARQEEIDVVVFVVSAANHFTQSAQEFIKAAAAEKAYLFIVVNGYDFIRDKERCQKMVLDQVAGLSPRTRKEASELVHFVSSNAIPTAPAFPPSNHPTPGAGGGGGGGGDDDPDAGDGQGKGKEKEKIRDFEALEQSLRRFVLEKRARSKLAPARTYLLNILNDMNTLATVNEEVTQQELQRVTRELKELEPQLQSSRNARSEVSEQVDSNVEIICQDVYDLTRGKLKGAITHAGEDNYDEVPYPGLWGAFQYADDLKEAMLSHIASSVADCEDYARQRTVGGVNMIKQLGVLHVGDEFQNLQFRPDIMFRRKRDALARQVDVPTELWDFVDWSSLLQKQEKFAGTGMALTVAGAVVPRMMGMSTWVDQALAATRLIGNDNLRRLFLPGLVIAAVAASAYILQQIPNSLPPRLASKISVQLDELDYVHANASRISSSVRKVLRLPADNLSVSLDRSVKDLDTKKVDMEKAISESRKAFKYFRGLVGESEMQRNAVMDVDLDATPPGLD